MATTIPRSLTTRSSKPPRNVAPFKNFQTVAAAPHAQHNAAFCFTPMQPGDVGDARTSRACRPEMRIALILGLGSGPGCPVSIYFHRTFGNSWPGPRYIPFRAQGRDLPVDRHCQPPPGSTPQIFRSRPTARVKGGRTGETSGRLGDSTGTGR